jgi:hypothetical protein
LAPRQYEDSLTSLETEYEKRSTELKELNDQINEKQKLLNIVEVSNANTKRNEITIKYFFKDIDSSLVLNALRNLGFKYESITPKGNTQTNAIWYGSKVDKEDVKLIAITLINSGVIIRHIGEFKKSEERDYQIQIGGKPDAILKPPLTIERVKSGSW